ncbi:PA0069 family radical SAM protein [Leptospira gomenensis]|uniref:PA0069 family radical SAM protein n=1 Tax=Leptospira gomenensis TaxID=2484974 RepID=A0A5F1YDT7_9LEPT|nr:PA0069 family radical SAM protein [Leptospira gomenensis]TGK36422.1 PA0069 family radical SAM protein [Leptospira gomenensis]TGK38251.1 PA0069 family radical SAM protein [Leptospira gomenensis]TGK45992.1 PA0069 family radical SAM protein [Leptospira gomenensis]TGK65256.1 PA0069 family radical SAM protein [Leptospira gomenensis]
MFEKRNNNRGTEVKIPGRFESIIREKEPFEAEEQPSPKTIFLEEKAKSIVSENDCPDLGFTRSINPYRGCEHGCIYCYARPNHAYVDLSPGIDFETKIFVKKNAPNLLRNYLAKQKGNVHTIQLAGVTDIYQPAERKFEITRELLRIFLEFKQPVALITKSSLVTRDLDLLENLAFHNLTKVYVSVTTLDHSLWKRMEPRTAHPEKRLETIQSLVKAGVPTGVMVAPIIPGLNDSELETILRAAQSSGARSAGMVFLRLPHEVAPLFLDWLEKNYPLKKDKIEGLIRNARGGKLYDADYSTRMYGTGPYAEMLWKRFRISRDRLGLNDPIRLNKTLFRVPDRYKLRLTKGENLLPEMGEHS